MRGALKRFYLYDIQWKFIQCLEQILGEQEECLWCISVEMNGTFEIGIEFLMKDAKCSNILSILDIFCIEHVDFVLA